MKEAIVKSYVRYLQGLYTAMLVSIAEVNPRIRRDCERDSSRLLSLVNERGLPFLMVDLAAAGKHFDQCLAAGRLTRFGIAGFRPYRRGAVIPRLFKGLLLRVFDDFGVLRDQPDVQSIRHLRQLFLMAKKVKMPCSDSSTWEHVNEFFRTDQEVRRPTLDWDDDELRIDGLRDLHFGDPDFLSPASLFDSLNDERFERESVARVDWASADVVQRTADIICSTLGRFNPSDWRPKHGPGAVADQRHTQFKYDFPSWPSKLAGVFPMSEFGFANYGIWADYARNADSCSLYSQHEYPSRLIAVPKTLKGPRLIASEPVSHQWCQQTLLDFFVTRLAETPIRKSIHFRDQTRNGQLALRASHTQSHATIDLSSASDRLSCWVVERMFRRSPSLVQALHASRTRWVVNTIDRKSPQFHKLRKFACMGSACTFPVQSYVFCMLAISAVLIKRGLPVRLDTVGKISREVLVFGDDIIVPMDAFEVLQGLLAAFGLKVNHKKTFGTGKFRESCGVDAYDGHDVTPAYATAIPDVTRPGSIISSVDVHNNFAMRGYWNTCRYVKSAIRKTKRFRFANVPMGSGAFGWYDIDAEGNLTVERRYDPFLQKVKIRVDVPCGMTRRSPIERDSQLLQYFTEARVPARFLQGERLGLAERAALRIRRRWVHEEAVLTL
ncbi:MAG: putative replicase protein [Alehxovirus allonemorisadaptatum]|uniref:RNA-directed RNA polymerase n=1 Tax=Leviviridae sp. TaxID=2027243 RepID=A0ABY3SUN2_9VIRU|nr:MAG: putative replicase protein [Leviviridae sp.]